MYSRRSAIFVTAARASSVKSISGATRLATASGLSFVKFAVVPSREALHDTSVAPEPRRGRACDACHANKTKCDGGVQCSLCAKRRIECSFTRGGPTASTDSAASTTLQHVVSLRDGPRPAPIHRVTLQYQSSTESTSSISSDQSMPMLLGFQHDFDAMKRLQQKDIQDAAADGLKIIIEALQASHSATSTTSLPRASAAVKKWVSDCIHSYFFHFHDRWAILHAPIFDEMTDNFSILATVCIVGSWFSSAGATRGLIAEAHDVLVKQLVEELVRVTLKPRERWPLQTYQAALLNIAFAVETGREDLLPRARLLNNLLITALRGDDALNSESAEHQRLQHYPGEYQPYIISISESLKRLAINTFKVDTYLALLAGDLPILQLDEINYSLTATHAFFNAFGLDILYRRFPAEPIDRSLYKICDLATMAAQQSMPSLVLIEDLQYGLLGIMKDIGLLTQTQRSRGPIAQPSSTHKEILANQLNLFKDHLDKIVSTITTFGFQTPGGELLLAAYSGKEEPGHQNWQELVAARIWTLIFLTTITHHVLNIHLYADMQMIKHFAIEHTDVTHQGTTVSPGPHRRASQIYRWAHSRDARSAVLHAISVLRVCEKAISLAATSNVSPDPFALAALSSSAAVVWAWTTREKPQCNCAQSQHSVDFGSGPLSAQKRPEIDEWLRNSGPINVQGIPLCKDSERAWLSRFTMAMDRGGRAWDGNGALWRALKAR
ncbi:hypothetical protein S7711_02676, partial [Stachybotrys chartarum IBT 7711]